jgi:hypothetical protein
MNQLNVAGRRKSNNLSKPLQLEVTERINKSFMTDRPRTPYPTSMKRWERSYDASEKLVAKKRKIGEDEGIAITSSHLIDFPSLDSGQSLVDLGFSSTELMRASESILKQVDWSRVALDVLGEERPAMFQDALTEILQARIEELLEKEAS